MRSKYKINNRDNVIFILFSLWLAVDTVNGFLLRDEIPFPVSQIYKLMVAIMVAVRISKVDKMISYYAITILYLCLYSLNVLINDEDLGASLILISKLITTLLFFAYFTIVINCDSQYFLMKMKKVFKINILVFLANIFVGLFGIGYNSYETGDEVGLGYCGFFYAINELSGVIASIFPWVFYYFKVNKGRMVYLLASGVLFATSFLLSTKSGIMATLSSFLLITYFYGNKVEKRLVAILSIVLLVAGIVFVQIVLNSELLVIQRFSWFMEQNGAVGALTSGRLEYWDEESRDFYNAGPISLLLGLGGNRTVEMDPYDALLNMGAIGFVLLLFFYFIGIIKPLAKENKPNKYSKVVFTSNLLLIITSVIAGHILFSSMAGLFIAISNSWLMLKDEKNSCRCKFISV